MSEPQNGRIGGGVLKDNLLRQGVDLAFDTNLLYLKVSPEVQGNVGSPEFDDGDPNYNSGNRGVISQGVGINTNAPGHALTIAGTLGTTNLKSTYVNFDRYSIATNQISLTSEDITLNATNNIFLTALATDDLKIDFNTISTTTDNTNIELRPNGNGTVNIQSNWNITGSLNATGDITFDGNLTLGNDDQDNVSFAADVASDIIPDQTNTSDLGSVSKQWLNMYSTLLNGEVVTIDEVIVGAAGSSLARRQGNMFYVSTLGSDTNVGDHQHGAFRTLKHALAQNDGSSSGPTSIHIFPGVYEEEFPLTVPSHVNIKGEDIRNTIIRPTVATQSNNAFLLEDDVVIEDITIKDFFSPGHAFSFTAGGLVNTRSPYIRNVTVITKGSAAAQFTPTGATYAPASGVLEVTIGTHNFNVGDALLIAASGITFRCALDDNATLHPYPRVTDPAYRKSLVITATTSTTVTVNVGISSDTSVHTFESATANAISVYSASDPRGFNQGDAGKGALIDGAVLDSASLEASMLFHSVTFITPGVDCITMTNGVRVEWLNSFTYFANRGLYATQGSSGKLMADASIRYGAELRSIGSACVYGNFGAVADGANTLMYLMGQNFAYIGTGKDVSNDNTFVVQSQETVELNAGNIVYTSTDAAGTFRVGDNFFVDYETGETSINADTVDFSGIGSITVNNGAGSTYIDGSRIDASNIRLTGNTVTTIDGDLNLSPTTELFNTDNNAALIVSRGTDIQRNNEPADIRYNTQTDLFEGFSAGNLSFGGIYSSDRQEGIDAHDTNNTIILTAAGAQVGSIDSNSTNLHGLSTGNVLFDNNLISTTVANSDLNIVRTTATNVVDVFDFNIKENNFSNSSNNLLTVSSTNRGYVKFNSTTGLVIPIGPIADRNSSPVSGETRYNTESSGSEYLETYNGETSAWQRSAGEGEEVTDDVLKELVDLYILVLG
jgi:hypothetical protein